MSDGEPLPVCFTIPSNPQAPLPIGKDRHQLHGADDLISLFELKSLWERSVKPYTAASRAKQKEQANSTKDEGVDVEQLQGDREAHLSTTANEQAKPLVMEKTYVHYVRDLPGQVKPPRRTVSKYNSALAAASSSGASMPTLPPEITGQTTMREIVFRPETTMQRIAPFDDESLISAFTVEAGPISDIDMSLLESDDVDKQSPHKKKKKRKHQRDNTGDKPDETSAKRSKPNTIIRR